MSTPELVDIDGWLTDDPEEYRAHVSGRANAWTFAEQWSVDVRNWKPWAFWIVGTISLGSGIWGATSWSRQALVLGASAWASYFWVLFNVVRGRRRVRLLEATARLDVRHPLFAEYVTGRFVEVGGPTTGQALLPLWAAEKTRRPDGTHQVLVAFDPRAEMSWIVGIRPG